MSMPAMKADVGHVIGVRIGEGKRVPLRVLEALTRPQLCALRRALQHRGKDLPAGMFDRLMKAARP